MVGRWCMAIWKHQVDVRIRSCTAQEAGGVSARLAPAESPELERDDWRLRAGLVLGAWKFPLQAWCIKACGSRAGVALPPLRGRPGGISRTTLPLLLARTDQAVHWGARWTGRKCFFRAYILGALLRRRGVPAVLNIGLRRPAPEESNRCVDGHCWVSVAGAVLAECGHPELTYPFSSVKAAKASVIGADHGSGTRRKSLTNRRQRPGAVEKIMNEIIQSQPEKRPLPRFRQEEQTEQPAATTTTTELPQGLKTYETPAVETHSPLDHVRKWRDRSSQLPGV